MKTKQPNNNQIHKVAPLITLAFIIVGIIMGVRYYSSQLKKREVRNVKPVVEAVITPTRQDEALLKQALDHALEQHRGKPSEFEKYISIPKMSNAWAYGSITILDPNYESGLGYDFLAHKVDGKWHIAFETTQQFHDWAQQAPDSVLNEGMRNIFIESEVRSN